MVLAGHSLFSSYVPKGLACARVLPQHIIQKQKADIVQGQTTVKPLLSGPLLSGRLQTAQISHVPCS